MHYLYQRNIIKEINFMVHFLRIIYNDICSFESGNGFKWICILSIMIIQRSDKGPGICQRYYLFSQSTATTCGACGQTPCGDLRPPGSQMSLDQEWFLQEPNFIVINKVLLEHNSAHSFAYCPWLFSHCKAVLSSYNG